MLFLTHSAGFTHSVVRRATQARLAYAEVQLTEAAKGRMTITATQDCGDINAENLKRFDAVLFYTTGELPIPKSGQQALLDWIRAGGAFAGSHSATDTFYEFPGYMDMVGGAFAGHPWHKEVGVRVEESGHPAVAHLGSSFKITDEIYQFENFRRYPLRVLMTLDPDSIDDIQKGRRKDGDYALAWCKDYGEGAMFYTALGHREDVWSDPRFQEHLMAGIEWAVAAPSESIPAPAGAQVLFDGTNLDGWKQKSGDQVAGWKIEDGAMVSSRSGDIVTRKEYGGPFLLHVEFFVPITPTTNGWQDRGNSGVYVQGRYEVQVLDSYGLTLRAGDCGAIYGKHIPVVNASRPAGRWQSYDIEFTPPSVSEEVTKMAKSRMSVWHNGVRIHDDVEVDSPTAAGMGGEPGIGPIMLQDHGHAVRYRNIWLLPR
ncbi:Trehalose utilization [Planctomycetes bacterium Poly30]|uniref:Trehalose utilization n=1 Tax=Saltatorellus ferox TaxID=2528018 RepID=A0A518F0V2_9BACT|nr:Trehalose utilization [Planctomycetes bacterium Poly30]